MDKTLRDEFLAAIAGNESSYGKNTNHPKTSLGQPGGKWGMKPAEAQVLAQRLKNRGMTPDKEIENLKDMDYDSITKALNTNADLDQRVAESEADVLSQDNHDNLPEMAHKWHRGVNSKPPEDLLKANDNYVGKFADNFGKDSKEKTQLKEELNSKKEVEDNVNLLALLNLMQRNTK